MRKGASSKWQGPSAATNAATADASPYLRFLPFWRSRLRLRLRLRLGLLEDELLS